MKKIVIIVVLALLAALSSNAQSLKITNVNAQSFPKIGAEFYYFDSDFKMKSMVDGTLLRANDNGLDLSLNNLSQVNTSNYNDLSLLIAFDLGLNSINDINSSFNFGKRLANRILDIIEPSNSEVAIISFDFSAYLNFDFSNDFQSAKSRINGLINSNSSNINNSFFFDRTGIIDNLTSMKKPRKAILLITDNHNSFVPGPIITSLREENVALHVVSINKNISSSLIELVNQSGGQYLNNVSVLDNSDINAGLAAAALCGVSPIEAEFESKLSCDDDHTLALDYRGFSDTLQFTISQLKKVRIQSEPAFLSFSSVEIGTTRPLNLKITAENNDIVIDRIYIENDYNGAFKIVSGEVNGNPSILLPRGSFRDIQVSFTPFDSAIAFTKLVIESNACFGGEILMTGGFPNTPPNDVTIKILKPSCDDILIAGDSTDIVWTGVLPKDVIQLEYSLDNGLKWDTLAKNVTDLEFRWKVPYEFSEDCLIRAIQLWPNNIGKTLDLRHDSRVNSAVFNRDGSEVVTASGSGSAFVWNSNLGRMEYTLGENGSPNKHRGEVYYAEFDPTDALVATASADSTAKIWLKDGTLLHTLTGHNGQVNYAKFTPDSRHLFTSANDKTVIIWDVSSGRQLQRYTVDNIKLSGIDISPDGKYFATCGNSGFARIWHLDPNNSSPQLYKEFRHIGSQVAYIKFSPDGKRFITTEQLSKLAILWDIETGDSLFSLTHTSKEDIVPINSANFHISERGSFIITASIDTTAILWDYNTGDSLSTFREHTQNLLTAQFNFDGSRVLTASWDRTAKIWNLDERDLQMDTTDCPFTISPALAQLQGFDFGNVVYNDYKDIKIDNFITNKSNFGYPVLEISIEGENNDDFKILNGFAPYDLKSLDSNGLELSFIPKNLGERNAYLRVVIPAETLTVAITGYGVNQDLRIITQTIDFGYVEVDEYKDEHVLELLQNVGAIRVQFDSIYLSVPNPEQFAIIKGRNYEFIEADEIIDGILRFSPISVGRFNSALVFDNKSLGTTPKILLFGHGVDPRIDSIKVKVSNAEGDPGDLVEVPIIMQHISKSGLHPTIQGFRVDITFNNGVLEPIGEFIDTKIFGNRTTVSFELKFPFDYDYLSSNDFELGKISFRVGLGLDSVSQITISDIVPIGYGKVNIADESALFRVISLCREGGPRLFDSRGRLTLLQNAPNPAVEKTTIYYEVIENGNAKIKLIDRTGKEILVLVDRQHIPGQYSVELETAILPPGSYFYILETPVRRIFRKMDVMR